MIEMIKQLWIGFSCLFDDSILREEMKKQEIERKKRWNKLLKDIGADFRFDI